MSLINKIKELVTRQGDFNQFPFDARVLSRSGRRFPPFPLTILTDVSDMGVQPVSVCSLDDDHVVRILG